MSEGLWLENAGAVYNAIEYRQLLASLVGRDGASGVMAPGDLKVTERGAGADGSVDVAVGGVLLKGANDAPNQGWYFKWIDAVVNKAISPTGGGSRVDYIVVATRDSVYSETGDDLDIFVVEGTEGAGAPTIDHTTYHVLAQLDIPAGTSVIQNSMITDRREYAETFREAKRVDSNGVPGSTTAIGSSLTTLVSINIAIPSDFADGYQLRAWAKANIEPNAPAGGAIITGQIELDTVADGDIGTFRHDVENSTFGNQATLAGVEFWEGETATGARAVRFRAQRSANSGWDATNIGLMVEAVRTATRPSGSSGQP